MAYRTQTTTVVSTGVTAGSAIVLDPTAKTTVLQLTSTGTSTGVCQVQMTLDDPVNSTSLTWAALSTTVYVSSTDMGTGAGVVLTVLSPIAGVRPYSTAASTASTFTLKALQSITA